MSNSSFSWRFFRAGGFDQVRLDTAEELLQIGTLDQKLWVALSCPVQGIEFDARTLALIDSDADGHVRSPELIAAVEWAGQRLRDPGVLVQGLAGVPLHAIRDDDDTGRPIAQAARALLEELGRTDGLVSVDDAALAQERFLAQSIAQWQAQGSEACPLGESTEAAFEAMQVVSGKIDDFFVRCRLAAYDARAAQALNPPVEVYAGFATTSIGTGHDALAALPLAMVEAGVSLPLDGGVNPAWADRLQAFRDAAVTPLLGPIQALTESGWQQLRQKLDAYANWRAAKPESSALAAAASDLERLARYVRDLQSLANNFVAFQDFYTRKAGATFQVGTLYLDGRSCTLCVAVSDPAKHAALAALSRMYLAYVSCVRGSESMTVAAAFTAGDADQLMVGRNGVFFDRKGRDWDATVVRIIEHPISLRQAFWSPYKAFVRAIGNVAQKMAANKAAEADGNLAAVAAEGAKKVAAAPSAKPSAKVAPAPFDVAKFAGIFAAIGLALGAVGTMLASIVSGLFALLWWQWPLALAGLVTLISGPAVALAWFKLRSRNLGPILDANGWAINARARINIPFGTSLTQVAQLPAGSERALVDPYAEKRGVGGWLLAAALVAGLVLAWRGGMLG